MNIKCRLSQGQKTHTQRHINMLGGPWVSLLLLLFEVQILRRQAPETHLACFFHSSHPLPLRIITISQSPSSFIHNTQHNPPPPQTTNIKPHIVFTHVLRMSVDHACHHIAYEQSSLLHNNTHTTGNKASKHATGFPSPLPPLVFGQI